MEALPEERTKRSEWGFPICCVPTRFFWLCERCSQYLVVKRWTTGGIVLDKVTAGGARRGMVVPISVHQDKSERARAIQDAFRMRA